MITSAADGSKVHIADSAVSVRVWPPSRYDSRDCHFQFSGVS
jgi:hypothetical protein